MMFKNTVESVLDGTQTQTRRPIRQRQRYTYAVGTTYAVQTTGREVRGAKIEVLRVREQLLGAMTEADARAEGYRDLTAFRQAWAQLYGGFDPAEDVWVVEFRLVESSRAESVQCPHQRPLRWRESEG